MQAGGYTLDLYCDGKACRAVSGGSKTRAQYHAEHGETCRQSARNDGWKVGSRTSPTADLCPGCRKASEGPWEPTHAERIERRRSLVRHAFARALAEKGSAVSAGEVFKALEQDSGITYAAVYPYLQGMARYSGDSHHPRLWLPRR